MRRDQAQIAFRLTDERQRNGEGPPGVMTTMSNMLAWQGLQRVLMRAAGFAALWWVLAEGSNAGWMLGVVAVILATWTSFFLLPPGKESLSLSGFLHFLSFFVWHSARGGLQVALMALRGRASLQPGLLELPMTLPSGAPQVVLVNALGLMPGTAGVDMTGGKLLIHVLDERQPILAEARMLETIIGRMFGRTK